MQGLTHRQERFIEEYLLDLNATRAAIRAGYSPRSAAACGWTLLQKPAIQDGIERAMEERRMRVSVDQDRVIEELAAVAFGNLTDFVRVERDDEGQMCLRLTPTEQVEKRLRPALADIRLKDGRGRQDGVLCPHPRQDACASNCWGGIWASGRTSRGGRPSGDHH